MAEPRTDDQKAKDCQKYLEVLAQQRLYWEPQVDNILQYVNHGRRFVQALRECRSTSSKCHRLEIMCAQRCQ